MKRKTNWDIYLITRNHKGNDLLKTNEILKIFGYSKNTYIRTTKVFPFIYIITYLHPVQYWKLKNNYVAVLFEDLPDHEKRHIMDISTRAFKPKNDSSYFTFLDQNNETRYFVNEEEIPFWKLAKYGGYII